MLLLDSMGFDNLAALLKLPLQSVRKACNPLTALLDVPEQSGNSSTTLRISHPSFRDFLVSRTRCPNLHFWIDEEETHRQLFRRCLETLKKHLKMDLCELKLPSYEKRDITFELMNRYIPSYVRYACHYWPQHLLRGYAKKHREEAIEQEDYDALLEFLQKSLIFGLNHFPSLVNSQVS